MQLIKFVLYIYIMYDPIYLTPINELYFCELP